jgi:excisionase family DNA binding protein
MGEVLPERAGVPADQRMLTVQEVADRCALSYATVLGAIHRGELRAARLGRRLRVPAAALDEWLDDHLVRPRALMGSLPEPCPPAPAGAGTVARLVALERRVTA